MWRLLLLLRRPRPVVTYCTLCILVSFLPPFFSPFALAVSPPPSSSSSHLKRLPRLSILSTAEKNKLLLPPYLLDAIQSAANKDNASVLVRQQRDDQESLRIEYQLFQQGKSSLRDISSESSARKLLSCLVSCRKNPSSSDNSPSSPPLLSNAAVALLLLVCGRREDEHSNSSSVAGRGRLVLSDAAHEVVLGVNLENYRQAEYTVTYRGQTAPWLRDHPLSDSDDLLHSILHRLCEGSLTGEGGNTGWANANYWAAGGPKRLYLPQHRPNDGCATDEEKDDESSHHEQLHQQHPVRAALATAATQYAPCSVAAGVVVVCEPQSTRHHLIIQGEGMHRTAAVPTGWWDPFAFVDLIQQQAQQETTFLSADGKKIATRDTTTSFSEELRDELDWLQQLELCLLLRYEMLCSSADGTGSSSDKIIDTNALLVWECAAEAGASSEKPLS